MRSLLCKFRLLRICLAVALLCVGAHAPAADWPTWRHDARRSAVTDEELPAELHLQWVRELPKLEPAWPDQPRMRFDVAYEPIVKGKTLFVASPRADSVTAYDTDTGKEKWRFYANGPVRFAPTAWKDKLYFVSDDGHLYCLTSSDGKLVWKFRGGPTDRMVLGNKRLISMWPARGAPVIVDGKIYFGAGIWPMMGIFLYALDAETGNVVWQNDATGPMWIDQPHNSPAFAGLAPQGYFALAGERLLVPNGRAVPASIDPKTGKIEYYHLAKSGKVGGYAVTTSDEFFACGGRIFDVKTGLIGESIHSWRYRVFGERYPGVLDGDMYYTGLKHRFDDESELVMVHAHRLALKQLGERRGNKWIGPGVTSLWGIATGDRVHLKAGPRLYTSDNDTVMAVQMPQGDEESDISWSASVDGKPESMIAADGKLFVSTLEGHLYCFGPKRVRPKSYSLWRQTRRAEDRWARTARDILKETDVTEGYCLVLGLESGRLVEELAGQSKLHVIAIDADAEKVARVRAWLDAAGLYGTHAAVLHADPLKVKLPPYLASLVVSEDLKAGGLGAGQPFVERVFHSLRPYGGAAYLPVPHAEHDAFAEHVKKAELSSYAVARDGSFTRLVRHGALPGSADWTHQYADAANTVVSKDTRVRLPLGLLWFGGSTHDTILPRHGHGPTEQVVDGRLFIEGPDTMRATDVYTGRVLWEVDLPGIGEAYDNTLHQPGANSIGSNYASARDGIYIAYGEKILRLDPANGETISEFAVRAYPGVEENAGIGFLALGGIDRGIYHYDDLLIAGVSPMSFDWDPQFRRGEFWRFRTRPEVRKRILDTVNSWKGELYVRRKDARNDVDFVIRNCNQLLNETSLVSRMSDRVLRIRGRTAEVRAIQEQIDVHLRARPPDVRYDTTLRALNRRLLRELCPSIPGKDRGRVGYFNWDLTSSREIVVMNRYTGEVLWRRRAVHAFRHNAICVGGDKVFCIDRLPDSELRILKRRGLTPKTDAKLLAFDLRTGKPIWSTTENVFGTWLGYSREHDILLQTGRPSRDMLFNEPRTMATYRGKDGKLLWGDVEYYSGPCMIHDREIITATDAYGLLTGKPVQWTNPLTGVEQEWKFRRMYGCNSPVASEHLLTFRSAAAGFYDLERKGGTGNFGGFKSGCTSNLIVAGGVLNAPDYTRTCTCSYQNQTSLALVHMPDVETWTFNSFKVGPKPVRRLGLNLGAPGDRRTNDGTLWLEYPFVGGPSPDVSTRSVPDDVEWFYRHSSRMRGERLKWVAASGGKGISELTVTLDGGIGLLPWMPLGVMTRTYTVRLYFAEPDGLKPGERTFDVTIQGRPVLEDFDVVKEAGGPDLLVVKEFRDIKVHGKLHLTLTPARGAKRRETLLCGIEVLAEDW